MQAHLAPCPIDSTGTLICPSRSKAERSRHQSSSRVCSVMAPTRSKTHRRASRGAGGAMLIVGAQVGVPGRTVAAENAAVIVGAAVLVDEPVVGRDAGEAGRVARRHQPLRHGVVGLADAADAAVAPGLSRDPGDQLDIVLLLGGIHESEFAFGAPRAAHVRMHIGVTLSDIPFDRAGLAPEKQRKGRHAVELVLVGRGREQSRRPSLGLRPIDAERDAHAVAHRDLDIALHPHRAPRCARRRLALSLLLCHVLAAPCPLLHCDQLDLRKETPVRKSP